MNDNIVSWFDKKFPSAPGCSCSKNKFGSRLGCEDIAMPLPQHILITNLSGAPHGRMSS